MTCRDYIHDTETRLYYLQSRYYNPEIGRFINADAFASTGQGLLGNNMFAYCNNNPVMGCDPCGTCFHRMDFWNDCEKCGGRTLIEKARDFHVMVSDSNAQVREDQRKQTELQMQLISHVVDAQNNVERTLAEQQKAQDILVGKFVVDRFSTPEKASETLEIVALGLDVAAYYTKPVSPLDAGKIKAIAWGIRGIAAVVSLFD